MTLTAWQGEDISGWDRKGEEGATSVHLLHGNGFCSPTLLPVGMKFPQEWNLLFTDVPGHGNSKQPQGYMPNWLTMARQIGEALESRVNEPIYGIGHSLGGVMTLMIAAERPHLFKKIVLLDPVMFSQEVIFIQRMMRKSGFWRRTNLVKRVANRRNHWPDADSMRAELSQKGLYKHWVPEALEAFIEYGTKPVSNGIELSCDPAWEASIFGSYPRGLWEAVRKVSVPVEIMVASDSYSFIARSARRAAKANKNISWQRVEGGHCFPMEQPEKTAKLLLEKLR